MRTVTISMPSFVGHCRVALGEHGCRRAVVSGAQMPVARARAGVEGVELITAKSASNE